MLVDDLKERLKQIEPDIQSIKDFWQNSKQEEEFNRLKTICDQDDFWQNPDQAQISKAFQAVKNQRDQYLEVTNGYKDMIEMLDLFADDEEEIKKLEIDVKRLCKKITSFKINLLMSSEEDKNNCFLSINSGAGGTESQDWASMLLRMYLRFCERNNFDVEEIDLQTGEEAGIKSATLFIKGKNAYGLLKGEHGVHRLVRISPFDANKRRHTSFASVSVTPEAPDVKIEIDPKDLRIDTYRASGAGGQHVNKTESAVRITHIPTNTVVQCQNERSQIKNRETAMKMLMSKLVQKQKEEKDAANAKIERKKIEWGSQIRSYVLHPYKMVKDHRTEIESPVPDTILDGDLTEFIEKFLIWNSQN
ncbi:MAG: Peptide chain release factor 2 [candidate division TM6 bacterium GW2011_GWF2_32_72]|nr:MAG: Peptide chain release factor 2 [candidate division TM6 bacterium GW2011_GWF2_32_72]